MRAMTLAPCRGWIERQKDAIDGLNVLAVFIFAIAASGLDRGLVIGLLAGFRNIGLVMATLGSTLPDLAWFYFAMVQFPIYLMPVILQPLARRINRGNNV